MNTRFAVDKSRVVYEVLEGEVLVVNLDSGHYYILDGTAAAIWQQLVDGATPAEVAHALSTRYPADGETILEAVRRFVAELTEEGLLAASDRATAWQGGSGAADAGDLGPTFVHPVLNRYADMAKLIQMDPIRDFDETGWPRRPMPPER
ncbi:MAG TPA: PqqD family protein [Candidatus Methylomirabilis sp.]|nr:PqqD family protein [Candidatus Methylomirabilis sp.]